MDEKLCSCYVLLSKHLGCSLSRRRAKRKLKRPGMKWRWGRPASLTGWSWWSDNNWQYKKSKQPYGLQRWKWSSSTFLSVDLANCPWRHCSNKWRAILLDTYYHLPCSIRLKMLSVMIFFFCSREGFWAEVAPVLLLTAASKIICTAGTWLGSLLLLPVHSTYTLEPIRRTGQGFMSCSKVV